MLKQMGNVCAKYQHEIHLALEIVFAIFAVFIFIGGIVLIALDGASFFSVFMILFSIGFFFGQLREIYWAYQDWRKALNG